jgi:hypothetical protein
LDLADDVDDALRVAFPVNEHARAPLVVIISLAHEFAITAFNDALRHPLKLERKVCNGDHFHAHRLALKLSVTDAPLKVEQDVPPTAGSALTPVTQRINQEGECR